MRLHVLNEIISLMVTWQIKKRSSSKAIAVCLGDVDDVGKFGDTRGLPDGLLAALLPGPITIVLTRLASAPVCQALTADLDTLALRVPGPDVNAMWKRASGQDQSFCRALAASAGALALTSANPSNSSSSISPEEFRSLWPETAYVFDGGLLAQEHQTSDSKQQDRQGSCIQHPSQPSTIVDQELRQGSTIVDLTRAAKEGVFDIVRQGSGHQHVLDVMHEFHLLQPDKSSC